MKSKLRPFSEDDCRILFNWANEQDVRDNAINQNAIPWDIHCKWFAEKLNSEKCKIFILEIDEIPVGQIRFDLLKDTQWVIDYSIDKFKRGLGYGQLIVELGLQMLDRDFEKTFIAIVKSDNIPSIHIFLNTGFKEIDRELINEIEFVKFKINK